MEILRIVHQKKASIDNSSKDTVEEQAIDHRHAQSHGPAKPPIPNHMRSASTSATPSETAPQKVNELGPTVQKPTMQSTTPFRRCHSQPEHPTSDFGFQAIQADRNEKEYEADKLLLLRKFSVCERDIVICNRVRRGINPQWFKDRERSHRSFNGESRRREYTLGALTNKLAGLATKPPAIPEREVDEQLSSSSLSSQSDAINASSSLSAPPPKPPTTAKSLSVPSLPPPPAAAPCFSAISRSSQLSLDADLSFHASSSSTLTPKERAMLGKYLIHESFANGSYGKVWSAQNIPTHQEVAVKIVPKRMLVASEEQQSVINEHIIHQELDHPNIIKLIECFEDEGAYYFIQELAQHGNLKDIFTPLGLDEELCRPLACQLLSALEYLHQQHIIHHDIKPENVLLNADNSIKLCDFGAVRTFGPLEDHVDFIGVFGTSGYIAPELLMAEKQYNCAVDMFSTGVLLFEMALGYAPYYPPSSCIDSPLEFPSRCSTSPELRDLLELMLHRDPTQRITASEAMRHKWFWPLSAATDDTPGSGNMRSLTRAKTISYPVSPNSSQQVNKTLDSLPGSPSRYNHSI